MKRRAQPTVYPVHIKGFDRLKDRARTLGMRAIRYNDGHVRVRQPACGGTATDFPTVEMAEDYLDVRERA